MKTMRKLKTCDVFKMIRIIGKLGLENIKKCLVNLGSMEKNPKDKGTEIFMEILCLAFEKLPEIESELCDFLGGICGLSGKEIEEMPPAETVDLIYEIAHKEEFEDFFTAVSKFFTSETKKKKGK